MIKKNDPILLMDRRFLMDFLSEEALTEELVSHNPDRIDSPSREKVLIYIKKYLSCSPRLAGIFIAGARKTVLQLTSREFDTWAKTGIDLFTACPDDAAVVEWFINSTSTVLTDSTFAGYTTWADQGIRMAGYSCTTAAAFFKATPRFMENCDILHIRKWVDWGIEIIHRVENGSQVAASFMDTSADLLSFMAFRELKDWKNIGLNFSKKSGKSADIFFSTQIAGMEDLYWPERNLIYRLTALLLNHDPDEALDFFFNCPKRLAKISPNVKDKALEIVEALSKQSPDRISSDFDLLITAIERLSYPAQQIVLEQCQRLISVSSDMARVFLQNTPAILSKMPERFLPQFVDRGLSLHQNNGDQSFAYFAGETDEAGDELSKWSHAVLLEDHQRTLTIFARALTGKNMAIAETSTDTPQVGLTSTLYPATDGETIFLPPYNAGGNNQRENFSEYKAATAHQAGLVEFGTFDMGIDLLITILSALPVKELALDIFYILEDGRIDTLLRRHYRGLSEDLDVAVINGLKIRRHPGTLPVQEALIEILLLLTLGKFKEVIFKQMPGFLKPILRLERLLSGFFENARSTWDCFSKTFEIYQFICSFPNQLLFFDPILFPDKDLSHDVSPYQTSPPFSFRGRMDPRILPEPVEMSANTVEEADEPMGSPLSLEELQQLIDQLDSPLDVLKIIDGKALCAPGIFIKEKDNMICRTLPKKLDTPNGTPNPNTAALSLSSHLRGPFYYDEWDYIQGAYRKRWCRLSELDVTSKNPGSIDAIYEDHHALIQKVKKQFQRIRPELHTIVPRVDQGDELDLPSVIQVRVDRRAGTQPSDKIFIRKEKKIRKIAVLLLIDMSASTGNPVSCLTNGTRLPEEKGKQASMDKKIIEIEIESLVVIMEALEALKDEYAIFGFSGYGREKVDFYRIKDFNDTFSEETKTRISSIEPKQSTRMGPAIRHAAAKLGAVESEQRLLILLSDGFPQDNDYGENRSSHEYGLHDTMMALLEAKNQGIRPFCITVDQGGNDYLKKMCDPSSYLVIQNIFTLPRVLPKVVESLIR